MYNRAENIYLPSRKVRKELKLIHADGHILGRDEHLEPVLEAGRYEKLTFDWVAYDPDRVPAEVEF